MTFINKDLVHELTMLYIGNTGKLSSATTPERLLELYETSYKEFEKLLSVKAAKHTDSHPRRRGAINKGIEF